MKILVINDQDGHCHAFDISTPAKRLKIYAQMAKGFIERGTGNWSAESVKREKGYQLDAQIAAGDVDGLLKTFGEMDLHFDRSGGGRMYEVEVETDFPIRLCSNVG